MSRERGAREIQEASLPVRVLEGQRTTCQENEITRSTSALRWRKPRNDLPPVREAGAVVVVRDRHPGGQAGGVESSCYASGPGRLQWQ